ncbi:MAG: transglycosylase domain-containing protein [Alphaproteobacteria bacterium]
MSAEKPQETDVQKSAVRKTVDWYRSLPKWVRRVAVTGAAAGALGGAAAIEWHTSYGQSVLFKSMAEGKTFTETQTTSPTVAPPAAGPYDERLGYTQELKFRDRLTARGYDVEREVQWLDRKVGPFQLFPIYNEKAQAGLHITDGNDATLFSARFPKQVYATYDSIPPVLAHSLLYVEDRQLLEQHPETHNPAINWGRFVNAAFNRAKIAVGAGGDNSGGSTLATQTEKFRHSPKGVTGSGSDKIEQMLTASVRCYADGPETRACGERIVLDYLNSIPLSSFPGQGEVNGFADGMQTWFGADFNEVNRLLRKSDKDMDDVELKQAAKAYREALSLVMAVKKPSSYLLSDRAELDARVDAYLPLLVNAKIISPRMAEAVRGEKPGYRSPVRAVRTDGASRQKSIEALQIGLMRDLGVKDIYALNRLDLTAQTTVDARADAAVSRLLRSLADPAVATANGLTGHQLLNPALATDVRYALTLYEKMPDGTNVLRIQADSFDGALDINSGTKLELGSTAKLRTLVSYLEAIADLHAKYSKMDADTLASTRVMKEDNLSRWALQYLQDPTTDKGLEPMLEASLNRTYSGNPGERFFTGGGVHTFENFDRDENYKAYNVKDAFHHSVNLSFIRMMRDIVYYTESQKMNIDPSIYENPDSLQRKKYLEQFIHAEGSTFLWRAWGEQRGKTADQVVDMLAGETRGTAVHLAVVYRSVFPDAPLEKFQGYIEKHCKNCGPNTDFQKLYDDYAPGKFNLNDRGYITGVHPLALWLGEYKAKKPDATWEESVKASANARIEVYQWLLKPDKMEAQNTRIRTMMEKEAFTHIHATWKHLGYSFDRLVPSYATSIGSSGDTPAALATLSGIIQNDGVMKTAIKFTDIKFAENTPYALDFAPKENAGVRVLPAEVTKLVRREMNGVVENGTARRVNKSVTLSDGRVLPIGGKTGTGDNREGTSAKSRTATFVFAIDDRFYGCVTAYVDGEHADKHHFTSALAASVLKAAVPSIRPVLDKSYGVDPSKVVEAAPKTPAKVAKTPRAPG